MKKDIHPERKVVEVVMNDGTKYHLLMALPNGAEKLVLDVDPTTHPAWKQDGKLHLTDTSGQVSKFNKKFSGILGD
ncbi:MAG: 50S ribosomal protein L31 [Pseudomonadota bacterium]